MLYLGKKGRRVCMHTHIHTDICIKYLWTVVVSGGTGTGQGGWLTVHCVPFYIFSFGIMRLCYFL